MDLKGFVKKYIGCEVKYLSDSRSGTDKGMIVGYLVPEDPADNRGPGFPCVIVSHPDKTGWPLPLPDGSVLLVHSPLNVSFSYIAVNGMVARI